ncbi:MAG: hypothetical protein O2931_05635 [Planctomycetota bacterium]|nr:hypothetical protein [Planctomycetota bacterium]MDA1178264.1 hypothetical protein [Planctomycetota bacterium]
MSEMIALTPLLIGVVLHHRMWYALPLVVAVSLVYAATRHELFAPILEHAIRFGGWLVGFLVVFYFLILGLSTWL